MTPLPTHLDLPPSELRRLVRQLRSVRRAGLDVPHAFGLVADAAALPARLGPPASGPIILLATAADPRQRWRNHFHLAVEAAAASILDDGCGRGSPARTCARLHTLGQVELDEVRAVLETEHRLLPPPPGRSPDAELWIEFAATWLELHAFEPQALPHWFPSLAARADEVVGLIRQDVPAADQLLELTRPDGFEQPAVAPDASADTVVPVVQPAVTPAKRERLVALATTLGHRGNHAGAARRLARAGELDAAHEALELLAARLADIDAAPTATWVAALSPLLTPASLGWRQPGARLLHDLQRAAKVHGADLCRVDVVEWALSAGRRSVERDLPQASRVAVLRSLRKARDRVDGAALAPHQRDALAARLDGAIAFSGGLVRAAIVPAIQEALAQGDLPTPDAVAQVGAEKLAAELADRIVAKGSASMAELRDAISRNDARLDDVSGPRSWLGDPLLRADRHLSGPLEGVYRRGEVYRRWLHRLSALAFGTHLGRWITRAAVIPFGGAYVALEGLQHIAAPVAGWLGAGHPHLATLPAVIALGLFLLAVVNWQAFRAQVVRIAKLGWRGLVASLWDAPRWLCTRPLFLRVWRSPPARALLKPAFLVSPVVVPLVLIQPGSPPLAAASAGALYLVVAVVLATPLGRILEDVAIDTTLRVGRWLHRNLVVGLIRWIIDTFRAVIDRLERGLYLVDERLRFRRGASAPVKALKATLGLVWSAITYVLRFYLNVLLEPKYNPVKHFPAVTVGHKLVLPFSVQLSEAFAAVLSPLGPVAANGIAVTTVFLLPGLFGFLAWELKENWRLYTANAPADLRPSVIGGHGESMRRLLAPGFHSGTVPKAFAKLRRRAHVRGLRWARARAHAQLHHVEEALTRWLDRGPLALAARQPAWRGPASRVRHVALTSNRVTVDIACGPQEPDVARLVVEEQSRWIVGRWTVADPASPRGALLGALEPALFARLAVTLDRSRIEASLSSGATYDVADQGLVVWQSDGHETVHALPDAFGARVPAHPRATWRERWGARLTGPPAEPAAEAPAHKDSV